MQFVELPEGKITQQIAQKLYNIFFALYEEKCGIITKTHIWKCYNLSKDKENSFKIKKEQYRKYKDIIGVIHSHGVLDIDTPSQKDYKFANKYNHIGILVISGKGKVLIYQNNEIIKIFKIKVSLIQKFLIILVKLRIL